eukprot:CAMPEP_0202968092 /NCGR_PEP_ID=MMETSP1396-20130829/13213_1 /ASSEMBLY_ACC=CAM_ASM_000872 /TAXON_ID= /ORGANISM="Pseudokeronopsis sp., Strain Brazil" /LENGTH=32 /DNA_ID= /DNA_START= /DNA_END= /DNA_ORIENTATION=
MALVNKSWSDLEFKNLALSWLSTNTPRASISL